MSYATVLVVDDVPTNLDVARGALKPYKLSIDCVTSGAEAIKCIREEKVRYSAIFMDHMMPGMDGIEAVRIIREEIGTDYAKTIPVIALTANAISGNNTMFLQNGFQDFLSKPIDILRLDQILHQWVRDKTKENEKPATSATVDNEDKKTAASGKLAIPGVNITTALTRFNNDEDFYLRILKSFVMYAPANIETAASISRLIVTNGVPPSAEDLDAYRIAVHSFKGSSRSIGADRLGNMADNLEKAAKQSDFAFIKANTDPFVEAAQKLIADVAACLAASGSP
jgi:CheY-like chemotaxis protein/HPt (histidine-containing phosphotransfer) domain-containing protein